MYAYTINLDGMYYAVEMSADASCIHSLDKFTASGLPEGVPLIRTAQDRDDAIRACARPYASWREAYDVARSAGGAYMGQLIPAGSRR